MAIYTVTVPDTILEKVTTSDIEKLFIESTERAFLYELEKEKYEAEETVYNNMKNYAKTESNKIVIS